MCSRFLKGFEISIDSFTLNGYKEKGGTQSAEVGRVLDSVSGPSSKSFPLHETQVSASVR